MKRFAGMMGALLLMPTLALANSDMISISELRQQGEAMGRWTQTYDTPNGKVSVDIPIIVPEVENVPILQVSAVMGKDVAEEKGLIKSEEQGNGILYEDFDILSKLSVDVSNAATIFCANPEETNLAFFQVNLDEPLAKRLGNWDYSSDYYYPNEMNPETLFAEENDQPLSAAERQFCCKIIMEAKMRITAWIMWKYGAEQGKELDGQRMIWVLIKKITRKGRIISASGRSSKESPFTWKSDTKC